MLEVGFGAGTTAAGPGPTVGAGTAWTTAAESHKSRDRRTAKPRLGPKTGEAAIAIVEVEKGVRG